MASGEHFDNDGPWIPVDLVQVILGHLPVDCQGRLVTSCRLLRATFESNVPFWTSLFHDSGYKLQDSSISSGNPTAKSIRRDLAVCKRSLWRLENEPLHEFPIELVVGIPSWLNTDANMYYNALPSLVANQTGFFASVWEEFAVGSYSERKPLEDVFVDVGKLNRGLARSSLPFDQEHVKHGRQRIYPLCDGYFVVKAKSTPRSRAIKPPALFKLRSDTSGAPGSAEHIASSQFERIWENSTVGDAPLARGPRLEVVSMGTGAPLFVRLRFDSRNRLFASVYDAKKDAMVLEFVRLSVPALFSDLVDGFDETESQCTVAQSDSHLTVAYIRESGPIVLVYSMTDKGSHEPQVGGNWDPKFVYRGGELFPKSNPFFPPDAPFHVAFEAGHLIVSRSEGLFTIDLRGTHPYSGKPTQAAEIKLPSGNARDRLATCGRLLLMRSHNASQMYDIFERRLLRTIPVGFSATVVDSTRLLFAAKAGVYHLDLQKQHSASQATESTLQIGMLGGAFCASTTQSCAAQRRAQLHTSRATNLQATICRLLKVEDFSQLSVLKARGKLYVVSLFRATHAFFYLP